MALRIAHGWAGQQTCFSRSKAQTCAHVSGRPRTLLGSAPSELPPLASPAVNIRGTKKGVYKRLRLLQTDIKPFVPCPPVAEHQQSHQHSLYTPHQASCSDASVASGGKKRGHAVRHTMIKSHHLGLHAVQCAESAPPEIGVVTAHCCTRLLL